MSRDTAIATSARHSAWCDSFTQRRRRAVQLTDQYTSLRCCCCCCCYCCWWWWWCVCHNGPPNRVLIEVAETTTLRC